MEKRKRLNTPPLLTQRVPKFLGSPLFSLQKVRIKPTIMSMNEKPIINKPEKHLPIQPLTKEEMQEAAKARVTFIGQEFAKGFAFLEKYPCSVTFFGGARIDELNPYYIQARSLAARISDELDYCIVTGGGPGIMEAANRGAFESGGTSIGLTIELPEHQAQNPYLSKNLDFHYFFSRKVSLAFSAEAYIFFPGGFGTFDELFEIITLIQTKKIEKVPVILWGSEFWKPLETFMRREMLPRGTIDEHDLTLFTITDNEEDVLDIIRHAPVHNGIKFTHKDTDLDEAGIMIQPRVN